jgi:serine/threonine-protein kinase RsbW
MPHNDWFWQCERVIPSRSGAGRQVQEEILEQLARNRWIEHDIFCVRLATEEALVNAIKHGNHFDLAKQVRVACRLSADRVQIEIADEGPGFNPALLPDPTDLANLESPCGRGIMLMRSFMSRVEFNDAGNCVLLEKERAGDSR